MGRDGTTAVQLGRRLGVTKQAAAEHIDALERLAHLRRATDADDARRKLLQLTDRGTDSLTRSARIFDDLRGEWAQTLGSERWPRSRPICAR